MNKNDDGENARQNALLRLHVLDTAEEQAYDDITRLAADVCGTPIALISLMDNKRQWFKSRVGLQIRETPRENSFCSHAAKIPQEVMIVPDASKDERFVNHPLVTADPKIRFYAGAPLLTQDGDVIGTICVIDTTPRSLDGKQLEALQFMAQQVMVMLESRAAAVQRRPA